METAKQIAISHDGSLTLAVGKSRRETEWKNRDMLWSELVKKLSQTRRTGETLQDYKAMSKDQQGSIKDVGGFVGGSLKGGRRKTESVGWRQLLTLDADHLKSAAEGEGLWASLEMLVGCGAVMYSTHSHEPERPRLRFVIPLSRAVTPDEYQAISRRVAADLGIDFFDDTTYEPHRLMYWPSTAQDGEFLFDYSDEPWLDPDEVLARFEDWRDPSYWPESSRAQKRRQRLADKQGDPLEKPGMVGAFNKTYTIPEAIETFLANVYDDAGDGRYTYSDGTSVGGLVLYQDETFAYSHHGTDPVGGRLVSAFDLVRIHLFGAQDEDAKEGTPVSRMPSNLAMIDFAQKDKAVMITLGRDNLEKARDEFSDGFEPEEEDSDSWLGRLQRNKHGTVLSEAPNVKLILQNDPGLKGKFGYDDFAYRMTVLGDLPWRSIERGQYWADNDDACLRNYLSTVYGIKGLSLIHDGMAEIAEQNAFHPVVEYLDSLVWDGQARVDTLFIDYLGAEDTAYSRSVARKALAAAVKRVMEPGCKFDYMPVLVGAQGIGKSAFIGKLGRRWFSDTLDSVQGKDAYEQLQGVWLMEMGELSATKKADIEAIKLFITKQQDQFRQAYGRRSSIFPRQCVFFGTTNDSEFLRDRTGNRRFWPIPVGQQPIQKDQWTELTEQEVNQIWAEAVFNYQMGESVYPDEVMAQEAREMQELHMEDSTLSGIVEEYLNTPLPEDWEDRDITERRMYLSGDFEGEVPGTLEREKVCAMEVWVEAMNGIPKDLPPIKAREINDIIRRSPGWTEYRKSRGRMKFGKNYGIQRAFIREF